MATILTNTSSLIAQRNYSLTSQRLTNSLRVLSTGKRINSAADDAAGIALAKGMSADIAILRQASRNANDGLGILDTMDSGLEQIGNLLERASTLAEEAATGTLSSDARSALDDEFTAIKEEITRLSNTTKFNDFSILNSSDTIDIKVGAGTSTVISIQLKDVDSTTLGINSDSLATASSAISALSDISTAIDSISGHRGDVGALANRLQATVSVLDVTAQNLESARSRIEDADIAKAVSEYTTAMNLNQASIMALRSANSQAQNILSLLQ